MISILEKASRQGDSMYGIKIGGKLHETSHGSIFFAERQLPGSPLGQDLKKPEKESCIIKTIDLENQNIWAITINNSRTTVRGLDSKHVIYMHQDREDAEDWKNTWCSTRIGSRLVKIAWLTQTLDVSQDMATKKIRLNEYLLEAMVGLIVTRDLKVPNFIKTYDAWITNATGLILQEHGGTNLLKSMAQFNLEEFQSIVIQVLAAMAYAQNKIALKHHDLHLENVFINHIKEADYASWSLKPNDSFSENSGYFLYALESTHVKVKHCGLLAKIADFGLSAVTDTKSAERYERVDCSLLDSSEAEWGSWNPSLEGQYMYDAVVFLSRFFMEEEKSITSPENIKWAKGLYAAMQQKWPIIECTNIGRPLRGREGPAKIEEIFSLDYLKNFV